MKIFLDFLLTKIEIKFNYFDNESAARSSICEQAIEYMTKAFMFII